MNILTNVNKKENLVIDSREVAKMLSKEHWMVLRDIEGSKDGKTIGIIDVLRNNKLVVSDYFIESSYKTEGNNKTYPCYLVTKMGCEILGNKQQGEKGILFTAKYVKRFNEMEQNTKKLLTPMDQLRLQYQVLEEHQEKLNNIETKVTNLENNMTIDYGQQLVLQELAKSRAIHEMGGKESSAYNNRSLRSKVFARVWKDFKEYLEINSYRNTPKKDFEKAKEYLQGWKVQGKLLRGIEDCNSQFALQLIKGGNATC